MGNQLQSVLKPLVRAWRKVRGRELWHWVLIKCPIGVMALGPYRTYEEAGKAALLHPDYHPRIAVELSWHHPWIGSPKGNEEVAVEDLSVISGSWCHSCTVDDCLLPPTED